MVGIESLSRLNPNWWIVAAIFLIFSLLIYFREISIAVIPQLTLCYVIDLVEVVGGGYVHDSLISWRSHR